MWSRFTPGSGWTDASAVVSGETTLWSNLAPHAVAAARDGTVHVAVPGSRGIRPFTYAQGGWTSTPVPGVRAAATVALILADAGRSLVLGYLAAFPGTRYDVNSVFVTSSPDGGRTWRDPRLLARSGSLEAFDLRAVDRTPPLDRAHLVTGIRRPPDYTDLSEFSRCGSHMAATRQPHPAGGSE